MAARRLVTWLEKKVLNRVPMYQIAKAISRDVVDPDATDFAVLVDLQGTGERCLGVLIEELADGTGVVFVPNAPSASTGTVHIVPRDRVQVLKSKGHEIFDVMAHRGFGLGELLAAE